MAPSLLHMCEDDDCRREGRLFVRDGVGMGKVGGGIIGLGEIIQSNGLLG